MDADERLTALKKAYADIILNTAKEAAARIMVSERKAIQFEFELKHAKEDGVRMLLRLKQMMDSQIREAAIVSCSQQKKIDELEAQLQEAEDIVKDLREELRAVEAELDRFSKSKKVKHTVQVSDVTPSGVQHIPNTDQTNKSHTLYSSLFSFMKSSVGSGDLPSIISRSKETEMYRKGCTQRIRACERTTSNEKSSFSVQTCDVDRNFKPEAVSKEGEVLEKGTVLEQVKEIDLAADNSCLTSPSSVRHTNDTSDETLVRPGNSQSTSGEEDMPVSTVSKICKMAEVASRPSTGRVIKYTFQRKRKRGTLTDGNGANERSPKNATVPVGPAKVNLIGESTSEKIRLEQVACQMAPQLGFQLTPTASPSSQAFYGFRPPRNNRGNHHPGNFLWSQQPAT